MRRRLHIAVAALLLAACQAQGPSLAPRQDAAEGDPITADARAPDVADVAEAGDVPEPLPPEVLAGDPVTLDAGGSTEVDLHERVHDPDTAFDLLTVTATSSDHVTATVDGAVLGLTAAADWSGTESIGLHVEDPTGLSATGAVDVVVRATLPDTPAPPRSCLTHISYDTIHGGAQQVFFASEANGWSTSANPLAGPDEQGRFSADLDIPAGDYGYKLVREGTDWILDPENPYRVTVDGIVNSLLHVPDCHVPWLEVAEHTADAQSGHVEWDLNVWDSAEAAGIDVDSLEVTVNREPVAAADISAAPSTVHLSMDGLAPGRYTLRARIADVNGVYSDELMTPVWLEASSFDWNDAVVYFVFTDRFRNGDPSNDEPKPDVADIVNWNGGDWAGVEQAIEAGYFDDLGVNALWISPLNDNPDGIVIGDDGRPRSAYHGYFPDEPRTTENHFGTLEDLQSMVAAAHRHGIRVIADLVANHVYETHPYYVDRTSDADFNQDALCVDIDWSRPLTCWFEPYLPDLATSRRDIVERLVDDALWWVDQGDLDGFRIDAVKHMDHNVGYLLRAGVDRLLSGSGVEFFMVGETFLGLWSEESADQLLEYVSPGELSSQFHFPLYWELVRTVARRESGFEGFQSLDAVVAASDQRFGAGWRMATFAGNHDVPRFVSHANGDIADMWGNGAMEQAFTAPPPQPTEAAPYERMGLALTLLMTLPGVPVLYYGDEIGLAGAGDPDNRRPLPDDASLNAHQLALRDEVATLGALRRERVELRRGARETLRADDVYAFVRHLGQAVTVVLANNSDAAQAVDVPVVSWLTDGTVLTDGLSGQTVTVSGGHVVTTLAARAAMVLTSP